jgi:GNAT superfamily N-acetyltransferase
VPFIRFSIQVDTEDREPSRVVRRIDGIVFDYADGSEREEELGTVRAFLVLVGLAREKKESVYDAMDAINDDTAECYAAVFDEENDEWNSVVRELYDDGPMSADLLLIDRIDLKDEHRGKGVGGKVVREVIDTFGLHCGLVVCKPFPLQYTGWAEKIPAATQKEPEYEARRLEAFARVTEFWTGCEFVKLQESEFYSYCPELLRQPSPQKSKGEYPPVPRGRRRAVRTRQG